MNRKVESAARGVRALVGLGLLLVAARASGAEFWLCAKAGQVAMPDGASVAIWGYVLDTASFGGGCAGAPALPGPRLTVPPGDATLTIHLRNMLPEPSSIVVPGQSAAMTPVWTDGTSGPRTSAAQRVRSFTHEAAPNGVATYTWTDFRPGTFLYHSGTHPQVQVQMGLYGAVTRAATATEAYAGVPFDAELVLLFSEVDPAQHAAIAGGTFGTPAGPTSTLHYAPKYFLVNGAPFTPGAAPLGPIPAGKRTLLRLLNAGLRSYAPVIDGMYMKMIAEDGRPYPWGTNPREQYSTLLPALKTVDAIVVPAVPRGGTTRFALYDRRLNLTTGAGSEGGMLVHLAVAAAGSAPVITSAPVTAASQGQPYAYQVTATDADAGETLSYSLDRAPAGMTIGAATGAIAWTPTAAQVGAQPVSVRVSDSGGLSAVQSFTIAVTNVNDAPVAHDDAFPMVQGSTLSVAAPGVLGNDTDVDGNSLTAVVVAAPATGTLGLAANGGFTYTPPTTYIGVATFTYRATDPAGAASGVATVTITVQANRPPVAVADTFVVPVRLGTTYTAQLLPVLANDSDPDTALDPANRINPASIIIETRPSRGGTATVIGSGADVGKIRYLPPVGFVGTEQFSYRVRDTRGAASSSATVRVNIQ
jgi:FtsP/CotA-like multicopper oxidase with cupredoxin domain